MILQIDPMIEVFNYISNGSPYGIAMAFMYLYLQEKKFSRELTQKTIELLNMLNSINEKIENQKLNAADLAKMSVRMENISEVINEIKRILSR
jgi:predicted membrane chloride channel (bestrophin family)